MSERRGLSFERCACCGRIEAPAAMAGVVANGKTWCAKCIAERPREVRLATLFIPFGEVDSPPAELERQVTAWEQTAAVSLPDGIGLSFRCEVLGASKAELP